jgi:hypothetical protein
MNACQCTEPWCTCRGAPVLRDGQRARLTMLDGQGVPDARVAYQRMVSRLSDAWRAPHSADDGATQAVDDAATQDVDAARAAYVHRLSTAWMQR